jgi:hypothetical protein
MSGGGGMWIQIEVLPIRLRVLLPMPMEETWRLLPIEQGVCRWKELEGCCRWNRECADGKKVDENTIVIKADYRIR